MRYNYHKAFFEELCVLEPTNVAWKTLSNAFGEIWNLCQRNASSEELETRFPVVKEYSPKQLAKLWAIWSIEEQRAFLEGLIECLELESVGDFQRGRKLLSSKLREVAELLQQVLLSFEKNDPKPQKSHKVAL